MSIALSIISLCGIGLSVCSITSFLPPTAGYCGGPLCLSSLIALVILNVARKCSESEKPPHTFTARNGGQQIAPTILAKHRTGDVAGGTSTETLPSLSLAIPELPDEIYVRIFTSLEERSVANASRVCLRWSQLASIEELWMKFCAQESFCPPAGELDFSYKKAYQDSKILKKRLAQWTFSECRMPIAKPQEPSLHYSAHAFLGTKDRFFVLHWRWSVRCNRISTRNR